MKNPIIQSVDIAKFYNRKAIFQNVNFEVRENSSFAITGKNGSGKSTLVKILCGLLTPTKGSVSFFYNGKKLANECVYKHIGLVSPYLNLYEEFNAEENLLFIAKVRGLQKNIVDQINTLLKEFEIYDHRKKEVKNYSSGMKQRLKYCAALIHKPSLLILDEPSSNLDEYGITAVRNRMKLQKEFGTLIFATNDKDDLQYADSTFDIGTLDARK